MLVDVLDGPHRGRYAGVASIGVRPTFGGGTRRTSRCYLLDFDGDLYGAALSVALVAFQRPELEFDGAEPLVAQMRADVAEARARLARAPARDDRDRAAAPAALGAARPRAPSRRSTPTPR